MRTQTAKSPASRTIRHSIEKVLPGADFPDDDNWNTYKGSGVPILWHDDTEGDDSLESDLKFDAVFEAAAEWDSSRN